MTIICYSLSVGEEEKSDGYGFRVYKHDPQDIYSLSNNIIWEIYEDREGILWFGTDDGLNKTDDQYKNSS